MNTTNAAKRWAKEWQEAWRGHDADRVGRLYAQNAILQLHPFRDAYRGSVGSRQYAQWAFESEIATPDVRFGEPVILGSQAACEYWALVTGEDGEETIAGIALLEFDPDGLVLHQRDYWHSQPGHRQPPDGWGR